MAEVSISAIVTGARLYADRRPGGTDSFVSDAEATSMAHRSLARLRGRLQLVGAHETMTSTSTLTTTAGAANYALPSDYAGTLSVRVRRSNTDVEEVRAYEQREYGTLVVHGGWGAGQARGYRVSTSLGFCPAPDAAYTIDHLYVRRYDTSTTQADLGVDGWEEWVMLDVACMLLRTGREPYSDLAQDRDILGEQLETMVMNRSPDPIRVVDVGPEDVAIGWPSTRSVV